MSSNQPYSFYYQRTSAATKPTQQQGINAASRQTHDSKNKVQTKISNEYYPVQQPHPTEAKGSSNMYFA